jgi:hypothetical protein
MNNNYYCIINQKKENSLLFLLYDESKGYIYKGTTLIKHVYQKFKYNENHLNDVFSIKVDKNKFNQLLNVNYKIIKNKTLKEIILFLELEEHAI